MAGRFKELNGSSFFATAAAFVIVIAGIRTTEAIVTLFLVAISLLLERRLCHDYRQFVKYLL